MTPDDADDIVRRTYREADRSLPPSPRVSYHPTMWEQLALEGRHSLITTLRHVEQGTPGYGTVVVPTEGYSDNTDVHNAVLEWLRARDVLSLNVSLQVALLEEACTWRRPQAMTA